MDSSKKIMLQSDYLEGCHPNILKKLTETNLLQTVGYGEDEICSQAKEYIKKHLQNEKVDIHFLIGGTSANQIVIASCLRPFEGVITVESGHINCHETGAVEATGHKVISLTTENKMTSEMLEKFFTNQEKDPNFEHIVKGKMVYISFPTEYGLLYTKKELESIYSTCKKHDAYLFIDGARLAFALACYEQTGIKINDMTNLCDVFYIGGTKCGALFGEAVVIINDELKKYFRYHIKQRGAMMAKGRMLGIQFYELFKENLYFEIGKRTVDLAIYTKNELIKKGVKFYIESFTNQQFIVFKKEKYDEISKKYELSYWGEDNNGDIIARFCTSWATSKETMDQFIAMF